MVESVHLILKNKGSQIWSLTPDATVYEAIVMMSEKNVGALLVVSEGKLVGIISERDYARKVILQGKSSKEILVGEVMTSPVITVTPDHTVDECMRIMTSHHIRHLPVLEGEKLAGAISIGDLVKAVISTQAETIQHLGNYITGKYPL